MTSPRIVTLDIETSFIESGHWQIWEENIGLDQIKADWTILSFAAKWLDSEHVIYQDAGGRGASKVRDDKALVEKLWSILDEADIVVTQNGVAFDIKKINARLITHGFGPYSPVKVIDTKLVAQKHFAFTSTKLSWMAKHLTPTKKSEHKRYPGFSLWLACLKDDARAWAEMKKYNIRDVLATEQLYLKLRPWIEGHPNVASWRGAEIPTCPKCGSQKVQHRGWSFTQVGKYQRFQCQACGGWARSRFVAREKRLGQGLLSN